MEPGRVSVMDEHWSVITGLERGCVGVAAKEGNQAVILSVAEQLGCARGAPENIAQLYNRPGLRPGNVRRA